jgi:FkbM family methyltransferase
MKNSQIRRHRVLQSLFWNRVGFAAIRGYRAVARLVENVLMNRSLHSDTNGELWLLSQLPSRPCVIDVGFHHGDFAEHVAAARPGAMVYAFDPARNAVEWHARRFGDVANVQLAQVALSDASGRQVFHDYHNACSSLNRRDDAGELAATYEVEVWRLDEWCRQRGIDHIDLLKIDAEGFDLNVLRGASSLLDSQAVGVFMFEYADGWIANRTFLADAVRFIADKRYRLFRMFNGFLSPFRYTHADERFDLGYMVVGVAERCLGMIPQWETGL